MMLQDLKSCPYCSCTIVGYREVLTAVEINTDYYYFDESREASQMPKQSTKHFDSTGVYFCVGCLKEIANADGELTPQTAAKLNPKKLIDVSGAAARNKKARSVPPTQNRRATC